MSTPAELIAKGFQEMIHEELTNGAVKDIVEETISATVQGIGDIVSNQVDSKMGEIAELVTEVNTNVTSLCEVINERFNTSQE